MENGVTDVNLLVLYLKDPDCDDDGIVDGVEFMNSSLNPLYSDPLNGDVNSNGIKDGLETDYDGDGLSDWAEFYTTPPGYPEPIAQYLEGLFQQSESYDKDNFPTPTFDDSASMCINRTFYFDEDTDDDGFSDGDEVNVYGTDPLDSSDYPATQPTIDFRPTSFNFAANEGGASPANQTLEVWNSGVSTLHWSVDDNAGWLSLGPTSGISVDDHNDITLSVDISGMGAGSYSAIITISDPGATNSPQTVPVNLTINPAGVGIAWNFPSTSSSFLAPTSANGRAYLDAAVSLPTGTEPVELLGVYWLDESTGVW